MATLTESKQLLADSKKTINDKFVKKDTISPCSSDDENHKESKLYSVGKDVKFKIFYVPSIPDAYMFRRDIYYQELLSPIISKKEFDRIVYKAGMLLGDSISIKKKNDIFQTERRQSALLWISLVSLLLFIVFFYTSLSGDNGYVTALALYICGLVSIATCGVCILLRSYTSLFLGHRSFKSLEQIIRQNLDEFFIEVNNAYATKGIRFKYCQFEKEGNIIRRIKVFVRGKQHGLIYDKNMV